MLAMLIRSDYPWENLPLSALTSAEVPGTGLLAYTATFHNGGGSVPSTLAVTLPDGFHYERGTSVQSVINGANNTTTPNRRPGRERRTARVASRRLQRGRQREHRVQSAPRPSPRHPIVVREPERERLRRSQRRQPGAGAGDACNPDRDNDGRPDADEIAGIGCPSASGDGTRTSRTAA